jgi:hypothetical protein
LIVWVVLTFVYWGNLFRFHPAMIDQSYDDTSEGLVIGRMARAAADGIFRNTDLGSNFDPQQTQPVGGEYFKAQKRVFENPELIHSLPLAWGPYPSHFALQGFVFSILDFVNPLPRTLRIGFYHFLASLFAAGMLVWIADILRRRFGWPAFFGFLIPVAIEPMFSALAPNLYWVVGTWFVPMVIGMLLADEDDPGRRRRLVALAFVFYVAKFLCGYEFTPTVIVAAAVGCMLGIKDTPDRLRNMIRNGAWIIGAGVAGFVVAAIIHAAKKGGFSILFEKAANRMTGDASSLHEELILGKFIAISTVLWNYLGGNYITLIKNFGVLLSLLAVYAVVTLLEGKFNWFLGPERRKLQILALAFLASIAAPLSWFVLAKAHTSAHLPIDLILWYVPTIPLGVAMFGVALGQFIEHRALWKVDAARSWMTVAIPVVVIAAIAAVPIADRRIKTQGTWAIAAHANGFPIFESEELGLQFRMTEQWFTVQYRCSSVRDGEPFLIRAYEGDTLVNYDFVLIDKQIIADKFGCISALAKSDTPISQIHYGEFSKGVIWERDTTISLPDAFTLEPLSDANWDRGINRSSGTDLLVPADAFGRLFLKKGMDIELSPSDRRTITGIVSAGSSKVISVDGTPIKIGEAAIAPIRIIRK